MAFELNKNFLCEDSRLRDDDVPGGFPPSCSGCNATMCYDYYNDIFTCPVCGMKMEGSDWDGWSDWSDANDMPIACVSCGGPWPDCAASCKVIGD